MFLFSVVASFQRRCNVFVQFTHELNVWLHFSSMKGTHQPSTYLICHTEVINYTLTACCANWINVFLLFVVFFFLPSVERKKSKPKKNEPLAEWFEHVSVRSSVHHSATVKLFSHHQHFLYLTHANPFAFIIVFLLFFFFIRVSRWNFSLALHPKSNEEKELNAKKKKKNVKKSK